MKHHHKRVLCLLVAFGGLLSAGEICVGPTGNDAHDIKLRQQGAWAQGQSNMAVELCNSDPADCGISGNRFNTCLPLVCSQVWTACGKRSAPPLWLNPKPQCDLAKPRSLTGTVGAAFVACSPR